MQNIIKVVAIGPESTGKSTLCKMLAERFDATSCPEYARDYLLKRGTNYTFNDLLAIAKGQFALEEEYERKAMIKWDLTGRKTKNPFLFIDTNMYVMKVWCEYVFGKCHQYIIDKIVESRYDLYLLCNIDLPWVRDELREYPDLQSREELFHMYKDILLNQPVPWTDVRGNFEERVQRAVEVVKKLF